MIVHLNGRLMPREKAAIDPFDRGFTFGDGIYEGIRAAGVDGRRRVVAMDRHVERMRAGLAETGIEFDPSGLARATDELLEANGLSDAFVYWQVTRGVPPAGAAVRSRVVAPGTRATVFGYCVPQPPLSEYVVPRSKVLVTLEDVRWSLGRVKSTSLMGGVMLACAAERAGADDALLVRNGFVSETTMANVVLVLPEGGGSGGSGGGVVTPSLESAPILGGVTRAVLLDAMPKMIERPVRVEELGRASEILIVGTTTMVASAVRLDGRMVGNGEPGPVGARLLAALVEAIRSGV